MKKLLAFLLVCVMAISVMAVFTNASDDKLPGGYMYFDDVDKSGAGLSTNNTERVCDVVDGNAQAIFTPVKNGKAGGKWENTLVVSDPKFAFNTRDTLAEAAIETYPVIVMKARISRALVEGEGRGEFFLDVLKTSDNKRATVSAGKFDWANTTDWQIIVVDASVEGKYIDESKYLNGGDINKIRFDPVEVVVEEELVVDVAWVAFFASTTALEGFDGNLDNLINPGTPGTPETPDVPAEKITSVPTFEGTAQEPDQIEGTFGLQFAAGEPFNRLSIPCPSWSNNVGSLKWTLYKWNGTYNSTIASTAITSYEHVDYPDNATLELKLDTPAQAGEYLLVLENTSADANESVGTWCVSGTVPAIHCYKEGAIFTAKTPKLIIDFVGNGTNYFGTLSDAVVDTPNPGTGDFGMIALVFTAVSTLVLKKKKIEK